MIDYMQSYKRHWMLIVKCIEIEINGFEFSIATCFIYLSIYYIIIIIFFVVSKPENYVVLKNNSTWTDIQWKNIMCGKH